MLCPAGEAHENQSRWVIGSTSCFHGTKGYYMLRSYAIRRSPIRERWTDQIGRVNCCCSPLVSPPPSVILQSRSAPCSPFSTCPRSWLKSSATRYPDSFNRSHR